MEDYFINLKINDKNLDIYYIRRSIFKALQEYQDLFKGELLDIGCGKMPYKDYILQNTAVTKYVGLDIETALPYDPAVAPDYTWDGVTMPFENERFQTAIGTEVLEHCPDPVLVLKEVCRILKPEGVLFGTVPFLWPLHEVPHDAYRYTPFSLQRHLESCGFEKVNIVATGGWHAALAQMLGLWVRRSPMSNKKRILLSRLLKPIIKKLISYDKRTAINFQEGQMITGLIFTAEKPKI